MGFSKQNILLLVLAGFFISNAIIAEIIGVKIFSVEDTFGFRPIDLSIFGQTYNFNMSAGVLIWPFVFIISDIINEYFGVKGVKKISYLTAVLLVYTFIIIFIATEVKPAQFWTDLYSVDSLGNARDINESYKVILSQGLGIIVGSLVAFLIGQILDALIFHRFRKLTKNKHVWLRATGSTVISQLFDSFIVLYVAFYLLGPWPLNQVIAVGMVNYIYKILVAILLTPMIYFAHWLIDRYLGEELAKKMISSSTLSDFQNQ